MVTGEGVVEVETESVFIETCFVVCIPESASVWCDFVADHESVASFFVEHVTEFYFEVDEGDGDGGEESAKEVIDAQGDGGHVVDVLGRGPFEAEDVFFADDGVIEGVIFEVEFDEGSSESFAFVDSESFCEASCGDIADDDFEGHHLQVVYELFAP